MVTPVHLLFSRGALPPVDVSIKTKHHQTNDPNKTFFVPTDNDRMHPAGYTLEGTLPKIPNLVPLPVKLLQVAGEGFAALSKEAKKNLQTPPLPLPALVALPVLGGRQSLPTHLSRLLGTHWAIEKNAKTIELLDDMSPKTKEWIETRDGSEFMDLLSRYKNSPNKLTDEEYLSKISEITGIKRNLNAKLSALPANVQGDLKPLVTTAHADVANGLDEALANMRVFKAPEALTGADLGYVKLSGSALHRYNLAMTSKNKQLPRTNLEAYQREFESRLVILDPATYAIAKGSDGSVKKKANVFLDYAITPLANATYEGPLRAHIKLAESRRTNIKDQLTAAQGELTVLQGDLTNQEVLVRKNESEIGVDAQEKIAVLEELEKGVNSKTLEVEELKLKLDAINYSIRVLQNSASTAEGPLPELLPIERLRLR